jgi:anti-sigma-K factor RskA
VSASEVSDETRALLAAHALGALEAEEAEEAERLVAGSDPARRVFEEALEIGALLALAVDAVEPPSELRERILRAVRAEAGRA